MAREGGASSTRKMTIMEHIREIQMRMFLVAGVFITGATLAYVFRDEIIHALLSPLGDQTLIYLNPAGGFSFIFLVSLYCGLALAAPFFIHQLYSFVRPTLPKKVRRYSMRIFLSALLLMIAGVAFGYLIAVPGALSFLNTFAEEYVVASLTADSYLNFIVAYTLGLGLVFQLPLVVMLIHWIKPMTPGGLMRSQRWLIVLAFIAAAIITPTPDPVNQSIIAAPIIAVYQFGVVGVSVDIRRTRKQAAKATKTRKVAQKPAEGKKPTAVASVAAASSASKPEQKAPATKPQPVKSVDGIASVARRPASRSIVVPERPVPTRSRPVPQQRSGAPVAYVNDVTRYRRDA